MPGEPPSVPPPPPTPPPTSPPPPQIVIPRQGMGCFAVGCLTFLIAGFIFFVGSIGGAWFLCGKAADTLTSTAPDDLQLVQPDRAQIRAAEESLDRVRAAITRNQETTVGFTAADLNTLVDQEPSFDEMRGHVRFEIAKSIMTIWISAPLDELPWKRLRGRWLNATTSLKFDYSSGAFDVDLRSLEVNGHQISDSFLTGFVPAFNHAFNSRFQEEARKNNTSEFWDHVKNISLEEDKMMLTTKKD